jgi:hypothetical protein
MKTIKATIPLNLLYHIEKPFNYTYLQVMVDVMKAYHMPKYAIESVQLFTYNRILVLSVDKQKGPAKIPRFSLLSDSLVFPILCLILANTVLE